MNKEKLSQIIKLAWDATELSPTGKIINKYQTDGSMLINKIAFDTFTLVLSTLLPRNINSEMTFNEPKEDWK